MAFNLLFTFLLVLIVPFNGMKPKKHKKFHHRRPESGVGPIEISYDELVDDVNEKRLLFIFDADCKTTHDDVNRVILETYSDCLTNTTHHYDFPTLGMALTYLDVNTVGCHLNSTAKLDWNGLCLDSIMYESLHKQAGELLTYSIVDDVSCEFDDLSTGPNGTSWALEAIFEPGMGVYGFPVRNFDNGVDIFVIDDGIRSTHDEFYEGQVQLMYGEGFNRKFGEYESHGTHVAGLAGGINYGSSKNFTIYDLECCLYGVCAESFILGALQTVLDFLTTNSDRRGVINMSLGFARNFLAVLYTYYADAIQEQGGIIVVAAGNSDADACYYSPAYSSSVITVGATQQGRQRSSFSNWGPCVDIWAPGSDIKSALAKCDSCYADWSGTSMASPLVAGVVANLLWIDPTLTFNEIKTALTMFDTSYNVTCGEFYTDTCHAMQYYCDNLTDYTITGAPTSSTTQSPDLNLLVDNSNGCNYVEYIVFDDGDRSEILEDTYLPTDVCIGSQQYSNIYRNQTDAFSYIYECSTENNYTVTMKTYDKNDNCSGTPSLMEEITTGFDDNYHYYVINCANDKTSDDSKKCNLHTTWYHSFLTTNETFIPLYEAFFGVDVGEEFYSPYLDAWCPLRVPPEVTTKVFLVGFCYKSLRYGFNYTFFCDDDGGIYEIYYNNSVGCTFESSDVIGAIYYDNCVNYTVPYPDDLFDYPQPFFMEINSCPDVSEIIGFDFDFSLPPTPSPTTAAPTTSPVCVTNIPCDNLEYPESFYNSTKSIASTVTVDIDLGDLDPIFYSMEIYVEGEHTWMSDNFFTLISPDGERLRILYLSGGSADGYKILFSDNGNRSSTISNWTVGNQVLPRDGTFAQTFRRSNPNGVWTLNISDTFSSDDGNFTQFCITELCYYTATPFEGTTTTTTEDPGIELSTTEDPADESYKMHFNIYILFVSIVLIVFRM